jgi:hypothetical protein
MHQTKDEAEADKINYPHPFGTFVYPSSPSDKVGFQAKRQQEFEN